MLFFVFPSLPPWPLLTLIISIANDLRRFSNHPADPPFVFWVSPRASLVLHSLLFFPPVGICHLFALFAPRPVSWWFFPASLLPPRTFLCALCWGFGTSYPPSPPEGRRKVLLLQFVLCCLFQLLPLPCWRFHLDLFFFFFSSPLGGRFILALFSGDVASTMACSFSCLPLALSFVFFSHVVVPFPGAGYRTF